MTMISPYEMNLEKRAVARDRSEFAQPDTAAASKIGTEFFNRLYTICALPVSLIKLPFAMRRKRLTGQSQPFLIRSPYDKTGFAIEPPKAATQVERLAYLAQQLEMENADANRQTVRELKDLICDLREEGVV